MRILLVVDAYYPSKKSQAKLIHDLGVELLRLGHTVTVLTPTDEISSRFEQSTEEGMLIARARAARTKDVPRVLRAIREERLSATIWSAGKRFFEEHPCDLVVYYSPSIFFGALVKKLKRLWRCKTYLVLRDIFPEWAVNAGLIRRNGLVHRFFHLRELQQYAVADIIGVQSPNNLEYFNALSSRDYRLEVLYNWTKIDEPDIPSRNYREQLGLTGKIVFFYGGNIGVAQDMDNIVRLARSLRDESSIFFLLTGEGSETGRLSAAISAEGLTNIRIHPGVDQRDYLAMLTEMDVGLISLDRRLQTENFPGKMLGYMQSSLPILASLNPGNELGLLLDHHQAGRWSVNGDDALLRRHAVELANDAELRRKLGANGRKLLEERFSARAAAEQIVQSALSVHH